MPNLNREDCPQPKATADLTGETLLGELPPAPLTPQETGLSFSFIAELVVKTLFVHGQMRLSELMDKIKLRPSVLLPVLAFMRSQNWCEVSRRTETDGATDYNLTELGQTRAASFMQRSQYAGVAPVSLNDYIQQVEKQSVANMGVTRTLLQQAFSGIVVKEALLDQFGAAMNSTRPIFIYGPPGSGKTHIAERLVRLLTGVVAVPHAVAVNGEIIQVFDPLVHEPVAREGTATSLDLGENGDGRWVLCRRPVVMTGAELTLDMVDLEFDAQTRFYHAPQQMKANNGLFILDDLGRQLVSAQELMDRWIVPLDRRIDYLTLHTGQKFRIPFDVIVLFSSNQRPAQLADEAFLRRLGYKIFVGPLDMADYHAIVLQECQRLHIPYAQAGFDYLYARHQAESRPLLACHPRDILGQVCDYAQFYGMQAQMSPAMLAWAWGNYFAHDDRTSEGQFPLGISTESATESATESKKEICHEEY